MRNLMLLLCVSMLAADLGAKEKGVKDSSAAALFDGKSFEGWEGNPGAFRIEDGAVVGGSLKNRVPR